MKIINKKILNKNLNQFNFVSHEIIIICFYLHIDKIKRILIIRSKNEKL